MLIAIQQCLPHMKLSLGPSLDIANCPNIFVAIDTCAGIVTVYYSYLMALAKLYPHCLYQLYTSKEYALITLSGIVQTDNLSAVTTVLG